MLGLRKDSMCWAKIHSRPCCTLDPQKAQLDFCVSHSKLDLSKGLINEPFGYHIMLS